MANLIGQLGEELASSYLRNHRYTILTKNFRTRAGEIDIICRDGETLVFVEVKTRVGDFRGKPYEAVDFRKLSHLKKAIYF